MIGILRRHRIWSRFHVHGAVLAFLDLLILLVLLLLAEGVSCTPRTPAPAAPTVLEIPPIGRAAGAVASPSLTKSVVFGRVPPRVGARWGVTVEASSELTVDDPSGAHGPDLQVSEYSSAFTVQILAVNGPASTKVRIDFERNVQRFQHVDTPTPLEGKSYIVEEAPPYVREALPGAGTVTAEEIRRVLDIAPELGTRSGVEQALPDEAMTVGEPRPGLAEAILRVIHPRAWTMNAGSASLASRNGDAAVFAVSLHATSQSGVRMVVHGFATIRVQDATLESLAFDGTFDGALAGPTTRPPTSSPGKFTLRRTVRPLRDR
jgi:hypothetical protein